MVTYSAKARWLARRLNCAVELWRSREGSTVGLHALAVRLGDDGGAGVWAWKERHTTRGEEEGRWC